MRAEQQSEAINPDSAEIKKNEQWTLEDHICRHCFARVLSRPIAGGDLRLYRCSNCGEEAQHINADALCCCGIKIRKVGRNGSKAGAVMVDAGVRCIPNPERSPSFPGEIVASEVARK